MIKTASKALKLTQRASISWVFAFGARRFERTTADATHVLAAGDLPLPHGHHIPFLDSDLHFDIFGWLVTTSLRWMDALASKARRESLRRGRT